VNFSSTVRLVITLPPDFTFTSESGFLFAQPQGPPSAVPEPDSLAVLSAALVAFGLSYRTRRKTSTDAADVRRFAIVAITTRVRPSRSALRREPMTCIRWPCLFQARRVVRPRTS
jgi:hypothetical protein